MTADTPTRDDLLVMYLDSLAYPPYPVQEESLLAWFTNKQGVLVCAPTGTGKTLIAEAALFEALHTNQIAYYTTPLIALTEQKFREIQDAAVRWGFAADDVGLVTGNRTVNPRARILVVVAEILLNRLLHPAAFNFENVSAVVMDEFHSFGDPERGIVWELSLAMLPPNVRLLLLSATVGNAADFVIWLSKSHERTLQLIQSTDRKVPLTFHWVDDNLLNELVEELAEGDDALRKTPALLFCFSRDECWNIADQLKGKHLVSDGRQKQLVAELEQFDLSQGAGPRLKPLLTRGVGIHHAGILPKYKRIVEDLFQRKLLSVVVCTETLAAGMNLPARSVLLTTLLKGPPRNKKLIDASSAHQMFGRAGRPQFDTEGHVFALAHEDDVKIARWKQKHDLESLEKSPDPNLRAAAKRLKKKMPTRRANEQYWNEDQFNRLIDAPPGKLASRGQLPWRLLAYLLSLSPDVERVRAVIRKRLNSSSAIESNLRDLTNMLVTLWAGDFVDLDPPPPLAKKQSTSAADKTASPQDEAKPKSPAADPAPAEPTGLFGTLLQEARAESAPKKSESPPPRPKAEKESNTPDQSPAIYLPITARPTEKLTELLAFRSINPVFASFLLRHLGKADREERLQLFESVLEVPGSMIKMLRVPPPDVLPPGPLARDFLDAEVIARGLLPASDLYPDREDPQVREEKKFAPALADKMGLLFQNEFPHVQNVAIRPIRAAADLIAFNGDFNGFVTGRGLARQEGILFRHFLRLILLCGEFRQCVPDAVDPVEWEAELREIEGILTDACRGVDPESTDYALEHSKEGDVVDADEPAVEVSEDSIREDFGGGLFEG